LDGGLPAVEGRDGAETNCKAAASRRSGHSSSNGIRCRAECAPDVWNPIELRSPIDLTTIQKFISVREHHPALAAAARQPGKSAGKAGLGIRHAIAVRPRRRRLRSTAAQFEVRRVRLDADLTSEDGQTLGYTWLDIVENWHDRGVHEFWRRHGVWESEGGMVLALLLAQLQRRHAVVVAHFQESVDADDPQPDAGLRATAARRRPPSGAANHDGQD
jgi:hypothetical protein